MSRNGSGLYVAPAGNPVVAGDVITDTWANTLVTDLGNELTNSLAADGQKTPTANLPMGGYRHTGVHDGVSATDYAALGQMTTAISAAIAAVIPPGTIITSAATAAPAGYLRCDGSAVSRASYAALFASIGTAYGVGDGSTTFNLPDTRGRFVRDLDSGAGRDTGRVLGTTQSDDLKAHTHTFNNTVWGGYPNYRFLIGDGYAAEYINLSTNTGSTGGTETRPVNIAFKMYIKY